MNRSQSSLRTLVCLAGAVNLLSGCVVGPKYETPAVQAPAAYKEGASPDSTAAADWKVAQPNDDAIRGNWWEIFNDAKLNALEQQVNVSNQTLASAVDGYLAARAEVQEARAQLFPTVSVDLGVTAARSGSAGVTRAYSFPLDASWTPDFFGRIRNTIRAAANGAQATEADLENTRLTLQTELAQDYFQLRGQDAEKLVLDSTVAAYRASVDITRGLYETGIDASENVDAAQAQLESALAQDAALDIQRAEYEHAIAMLTGQPASTFSIPPDVGDEAPPIIPAGVPSQLLERRPDIAAAERLAAQANAQVGVGVSAFYPAVNLSASAGFDSGSFSKWFTWPSRFFSVGPGVSETLFDGGLRSATLEQYRHQYDEAVANYRQAVLTAFQQVEDDLASLRVLEVERQHQRAAVAAAQKSLDEEMDRYRLGLDPYLDVITAQTTLLSDQEAVVTLRTQQMVSSSALITALGGGWDRSQLPDESGLIRNLSLSPGL